MVTCIVWLNTQAATRLLQQSVPNRDDPKIDQWIQMIRCSTISLWWIEKVFFIVNVNLKQKRATHITIYSIILFYVIASPITTILNRKRWTLMVHFKQFLGFGANKYCKWKKLKSSKLTSTDPCPQTPWKILAYSHYLFRSVKSQKIQWDWDRHVLHVLLERQAFSYTFQYKH